jgi:hypothetical protein
MRNKLAGTKTGKSKSAKYYQTHPEARKKKVAYDTEYQDTPARKKYRTILQAINRENGTHGNHDGLDAYHKGGKIVGFKSQSSNRGSKTDSPGDRRARGGKRN